MTVYADNSRNAGEYVGEADIRHNSCHHVAHGVGTYTYPDGSKYSGEWCDGKRHGQGTWWASAYEKKRWDQYVVEWKNGMRHGEGVLAGKDLQGNDYVEKGIWKNDELV